MLTDAWTDLRYHPQQSAALATEDRFVNLACGRGSGKTEIARRKIIACLPVKKPWPNPLYFYALPTFNQAKRVAWGPLCDLIPPNWVKKIHNSGLMIETVFGSKLYVVGCDKPARLEGVQWDGGVIDESSDVKPGTFDRSIVPALEHRQAWCWRIGVPKRYGVGAADFHTFWQKGMQNVPGISSYQWPSSDILTPEQLAWARDNLSPEDFEEQYGAMWGTAGGTVFHAFDENENVKEVPYNPQWPICVSSDFNVSPMSWVIGHRFPNGLHIFDEISLNNTNTPKTLNKLFEMYGQHPCEWEFYGDASGQANKTSADMSDYIHIFNDQRFRPKRLFYPKANPRVARRFAATNALLCNAKGVRRLHIHPRCKNLIHDLKYRNYKEGTRLPQDEGMLGHMTDALGYLVHRRFPLKAIAHTPPKVHNVS